VARVNRRDFFTSQDANRCLQDARAKLDEAAGLLAVVEYMRRADATDEETATERNTIRGVLAARTNGSRNGFFAGRTLLSTNQFRNGG
jgi:hypothetical protein